ncbi:hypothetical protein PCE1_000354 [Barthelona sp. PCE]
MSIIKSQSHVLEENIPLLCGICSNNGRIRSFKIDDMGVRCEKCERLFTGVTWYDKGLRLTKRANICRKCCEEQQRCQSCFSLLDGGAGLPTKIATPARKEDVVGDVTNGAGHLKLPHEMGNPIRMSFEQLITHLKNPTHDPM